MNLPKDVWYVRLFRVCLFVWATFRFGSEWRRGEFLTQHSTQTNLCFFMRTILVWAPLVIVLHLLAYSAAITALAVAPVYFFGGVAYGVVWLIVALIALSVVGLVAFIHWYDELPPRPAGEIRVPSGASVVAEWLAAKKAKICPIITFTEARS